jgi:hypothetical protein
MNDIDVDVDVYILILILILILNSTQLNSTHSLTPFNSQVADPNPGDASSNEKRERSGWDTTIGDFGGYTGAYP